MSRRARAGSALSFVAALALPLAAQDHGQVEARFGGYLAPRVTAGYDPLDIPQPPRAVLPQIPAHPLPAVPVGNGPHLPPGPGTPPPDPLGPLAPGDLRVFHARDADSGGNLGNIGEPTCALNRDVVFYTGNTYASRSLDGGMTWTLVNPATMFPTRDGGFCCDQYLLRVPTHDLIVWVLQYRQSMTTGAHRVAICRNRADLISGVWTYFDLTPQTLGFASGAWFDFPHVAFDNDGLLLSANVFDQASANLGSSVVRLNLNDLQAGRATPVIYFATGSTGPFSFRFTHGATTNMYWAAHRTTSQLRVYRWPAGGSSISWWDRNISQWYTGTMSATDPDGRDWAGRCDNRIQAAYVAGGVIGFLWGSNQNSGAGYPRPFTRVARLRESDIAVVDEQSIWWTTTAYLYPSIAVNSRGHLGGTICYGGTNNYLTTGVFVVDDFHTTFGPLDYVGAWQGTTGTASNVWGDFFTTTPHSTSPTTWVGTGLRVTSTTNRLARPGFLWFGRERDTPAWANLAVSATTPAATPTITVNRRDLDGNQNGVPPFTRRYQPRQELQLTAPALNTNGTFAFERWVLDGVNQPIDQRTLNLPDLAGGAHTAQARYVAAAEMDLQSNPTGATLTVTPADVLGLASGVAPFRRTYRPGTAVSMTAPATWQGRPFYRWTIQGNGQTAGQRTLNLASAADGQYRAEYGVHQAGSFTLFGTGCPGRGGLVLGQQVSPVSDPEIGTNIGYTVFNAFPLGAALMFEGFSSSNWSGIPLPLPIPGTTCTIYTDFTVSYPSAINLAGLGFANLQVPNDTQLIGARYYTQWLGIDGTTALGFTLSNAVQTILGGTR